MSNAITFVLDGKRVSLTGNQANATVLNYLRDYLNRRGTKEGCAEGDCGACTVVIVDLFEGELRYRSVNSCIQFVPVLDGKILYTVESLRSAAGDLHPAQSAMVDCHASQCGFCTPGFVMSLFALFKTNAKPSCKEISDAISGNLCRCTGYRPILDAGSKMYDYDSPSKAWQDGADLPTGSEALLPIEKNLKETLLSMQRAIQSKVIAEEGRTFYAPTTTEEVATLKQQNPDALILAGGTDVGLWVTKKHMDLEKIIYLGKVTELEYVSETGDHIEVGAAASLEYAFEKLTDHYPELLDLYKRFASLPIRNAGTLVGNLANGSPIGDAAPALIVLGASVVIRLGAKTRQLPLEELYLDYMQKDMSDEEFVQAVRVPKPNANKNLRVYKITKRFEQDISAVCGAYYAEISDGKVVDIRICYGGMAATTKRATACEQALIGHAWNEETVVAAMEKLSKDYTPLTDMRASADYRASVAKNLLNKFYLEMSGELSTIDVRV